MYVPGLRGPDMPGLLVIGNGREEVITGRRATGTPPGRAKTGNQVIGKNHPGVTDGVKDPGSKRD
jgi:hypothetical protein